MNSAKKCNGPMNNSKNKLNSEIVFIFHPNPNAHLGSIWIPLILLKTKNTVAK